MDGNNHRKMILAIDFGTTYSGAAYAFPIRPGNISVISDWPSTPCKLRPDGCGKSEKVPTQLRYQTGKEPEWGYLVPADAHTDEVLRLIKLALEPKQVPEESDAARTIAALRAVHDIDKLIEDYLSGFLSHVLATISDNLTAAVLTYDINIILTVPAIWTEKSTQRTMRALEKAHNFPAKAKITVLSEPEAAAIYTLHKIDRHDLKVGDTFVVVDAGGGTVDLITYTINSLHPNLEVTEAAPGSGGMCGSQLLNSRFIQHLDSYLGNEDGYDDDTRQEALDCFERKTKRKFTTKSIPHDMFVIPVPGLARNWDLGIRTAGRYFLKGTDMHKIFEPIVMHVIKLIQEQIIASNVAVRKIMLVGGFGQSEYLKERIIAATRGNPGGPIEVLQPEGGWESVIQGAAIKGLASYVEPGRLAHVRVKARAARKHYGTEVGTRYRADLHSSLEHKRWFDGFDGTWRVDVMDWFIQRGEPVSEQAPFYKHLSMTQRVAWGRPTIIRSEIYADDQSRDAPLARNSSVDVLCVLEADLSSIPVEDLDRQRGADGEMYYVVEFQIESVYTAASTSYTLIHKGHRYPTVTAEYV